MHPVAALGLDRLRQDLGDAQAVGAGNRRVVDDDRSVTADRQAARADKDWARADALRDELDALGIIVMDTPTGPTWKVRLAEVG